MQASIPVRAPTFVSQRRLFEQKLSELHKCNNLNQLKQLHALIYRSYLHQDPFISTKLITSYSNCRQMVSAISVFNQVQTPNVHLYNTMIRAHVHNSQPLQAFDVFYRMQCDGVWPDNFTYPFLLKAFSGQSYVSVVRMVHAHVEKFGFYSDIFVPNALLDSYSRCGVVGVHAARKLFGAMEVRDTVSWNTMIGGLVKSGEVIEGRKVFDEMPERDSVSWNTMIDGYVKGGEMNAAFELFERMPERNVVSWSTMISGYSKAGDMETARMLFDKMPVKNLVSWTIIISGYAEKGCVKEAIELYDRMEEALLRPDDGTIISVLAACAESGLLGLGERVHETIERSRYKCSVHVCNALVDMYAKCGSLNRALSVFNGMRTRDLVSWNAIIHGLAMHGNGSGALQLFTRMKQEGFVPDKVTLVSVLCACTHGGFVDDGIQYFYNMERDYGVTPEIEHYGCIIDLLGRGGRLNEAFQLVHDMPIKPNNVIWGALLGACRMHNAVELAEEVLNQLVKLEPNDAGNLSMLSNIYAAAGNWDKVSDARLKMKNTGSQKLSGASLIELDNEVHEFTVVDKSHPKSVRIYQMINGLSQHLKKDGYIANEILKENYSGSLGSSL
ncbi:hypothetical protein ACET3Z_011257 [Daucus carota]